MLKFFFMTFFLASCAGYHFDDKTHFFKENRISSIYILPVREEGFLPEVPTFVTLALEDTFNELPDITLTSHKEVADAYIYSIVTMEEKLEKVLNASDRVVANVQPTKNGELRPSFYIPSSSMVQFTVHFFVISSRNFLNSLDKLAEEKLLSIIKQKKDVLRSYSFTVSQKYSRNVNSEDAQNLNSTQNEALLRLVLKELSQKSVNKFKEVLFYEF